MKILSIFLVVMFSCFRSTTLFAADASEYETDVKALSRNMEFFRELLKPKESYDDVFRRDPMKPLIDSTGNIVNPAGLQEGFEGLAIQGVISSKEFKAVLVDNQFYLEGQTVGPYKILEIRPDGFLAQTTNGNVFIPLYQNRVDQEKPLIKPRT